MRERKWWWAQGSLYMWSGEGGRKREAEREVWVQALWGTVMERTLPRTLPPSATSLLPPDFERVLYLVWALNFLPS